MVRCCLVAAARFCRMLGLVIASVDILVVLPARSRVASGDEPAVSPFRWTHMERHPENPIFRARPDTWESQWFIVDTVLQVDGRWWMYYDGAGPQDKKSTTLGLAFSDDGVHWERGKDNPIWTKAGNWSNFLRDVRVHRFEGEPGFWMYYSDGDRHIDLARSDDGIHWTKHAGNPVLPLGEPGAWDDYSAFQPWVFYRDGYYHMFYTGSSRSSPTGYQFGYAWSTDGIAWQKSPDNPVFRPSREKGAWNAGKVSMHVVAETGDETFNIYYSGGVSPEATYAGIGLIRARLTKAAASR